MRRMGVAVVNEILDFSKLLFVVVEFTLGSAKEFIKELGDGSSVRLFTMYVPSFECVERAYHIHFIQKFTKQRFITTTRSIYQNSPHPLPRKNAKHYSTPHFFTFLPLARPFFHVHVYTHRKTPTRVSARSLAIFTLFRRLWRPPKKTRVARAHVGVYCRHALE